MRNSVIVLFFGVFVVLALAVVFSQHTSDQKEIYNWAKNNGYLIVEVRKPGIFEAAPWIFKDDDDRIYRATLKNRNEKVVVVWFKFSVFEMAIKQP